jgi:hypothetical protein
VLGEQDAEGLFDIVLQFGAMLIVNKQSTRNSETLHDNANKAWILHGVLNSESMLLDAKQPEAAKVQ